MKLIKGLFPVTRIEEDEDDESFVKLFLFTSNKCAVVFCTRLAMVDVDTQFDIPPTVTYTQGDNFATIDGQYDQKYTAAAVLNFPSEFGTNYSDAMIPVQSSPFGYIDTGIIDAGDLQNAIDNNCLFLEGYFVEYPTVNVGNVSPLPVNVANADPISVKLPTVAPVGDATSQGGQIIYPYQFKS